MRVTATPAVLLLSLVLLGSPTTEASFTIPAGYDLLETDPATTYQMLSFPAGTLAPHCNAGFEPPVQVFFKGVPFDCFQGTCALHPTDTIVRRLAAADPPTEAIPIEIVALSLVSVAQITVACAGGNQLWNVELNIPEGDPNQTQGSMTITHETGTNGGTFTSVLPVRPQITYRRVGGGAPATVGPMLLAAPITFCAGAVNRAPCGLAGTGPIARWSHVGNPLDDPAGDLVVSFGEVDPVFFPGILCPNCPGGGGQLKKILTEEESLQAKHGVLAAEKKHHYKCYDIVGPALNQNVTLVDEFGATQLDVLTPKYVCPPALKNGRGDLGVPHLKCYNINGPTPGVLVDLLSQFGLEPLVQIGQAKMLCMPALKAVVAPVPEPAPPGPPPPSPHYTCYTIAGPDPPVTADIDTQFGHEEDEPIMTPAYKCVPSIKNGEGHRKHPDLKCYNILGNDPPHVINLQTQFGFENNLQVGQAKLLCIPVKEVCSTPGCVQPIDRPATTRWGTIALGVMLALGLGGFLMHRRRGRMA